MNTKATDLDNIDYFLVSYEWQRITKYAVYEKNELELVFDTSNYVEIYRSCLKMICLGIDFPQQNERKGQEM